MIGYLTPLLLLGVGGFVLWYNAHHASSVFRLQYLDLVFPSLAGDLPAQGQASAAVFLALGGLALTWRIVRDLHAARVRARKDEAE